MTHTHRWRTLAATLLALALALTAVGTAEARGKGRSPGTSDLLPIVFVHGQSGSAQQFETQAMRFTSNGYPQDLLFAYEYDTSVPTNDLDRLDAFLDEVLAETGAEQVNAIGHSRGTAVWTQYLISPDHGPAKVAKYVNIDGFFGPTLPGDVPAIGIWGEWNSAGSGYNRRGDVDTQLGPDPDANFHFPGQAHTEVATSAEAFAPMFEFLTGRAPRTTEILPEPLGKVTIAGRAVLFPQNVGYEGTTLEVWRVDPDTGQRVGSRPRATTPIDATGDFGPVRVNPRHHYELALLRPDDTAHHYYFEPFTRSDHFIRLNTSPAGEGIAAFLPSSPEHTNINALRQRELWGDQGERSDELTVDGLDILTPETSPRSGVIITIFATDHELDGVTDLGKGQIPPFGGITFISAVDVFVPASPTGEGSVEVALTARGGESRAVLNVPNRPSEGSATTVQFRDDVRRFETVLDVVRAKLQALLR